MVLPQRRERRKSVAEDLRVAARAGRRLGPAALQRRAAAALLRRARVLLRSLLWGLVFSRCLSQARKVKPGLPFAFYNTQT